MATDNRKVSGYLPQYIFDVFENFREKRSLSTSSALITILSEYFQVDQKVDYQSSLLSDNEFVSKDRFEALEGKLSELNSSLLSELDKLVEQRFSSLRSELLNSLPKLTEPEAISSVSSAVSEPLKSEPLIEAEAILVENELPSEPSDESPHLQLKIIDPVLEKEDSKTENPIHKSTSEQSNFALSESSNSIQTKLLAKRLNVRSETISTHKKNMPEQEFYDWLQGKDPDKISWKPVGGSLKGYSKGWIPAENMSSELLSRLKEWFEANPN